MDSKGRLFVADRANNRIQIFELYPDEWFQANGATEWQPYQPAMQAKYKAALQAASRTLGVAAIK